MSGNTFYFIIYKKYMFEFISYNDLLVVSFNYIIKKKREGIFCLDYLPIHIPLGLAVIQLF